GANEAEDLETLRRDGANRSAVLQPLPKPLMVGDAELHARVGPLVRVALAHPARERMVNGGGGAVLRPVAGKASLNLLGRAIDRDRCHGRAFPRPFANELPVGDVEVHASGGPLFRIALAGPDREGILKGGDGPLQVLGPVADAALPIGNA